MPPSSSARWMCTKSSATCESKPLPPLGSSAPVPVIDGRYQDRGPVQGAGRVVDRPGPAGGCAPGTRHPHLGAAATDPPSADAACAASAAGCAGAELGISHGRERPAVDDGRGRRRRSRRPPVTGGNSGTQRTNTRGAGHSASGVRQGCRTRLPQLGRATHPLAPDPPRRVRRGRPACRSARAERRAAVRVTGPGQGCVPRWRRSGRRHRRRGFGQRGHRSRRPLAR